MKASSKLESESSKNDTLNLRDSIAYGILDSLLTGISFYLGFVIYKSLSSNLPFMGKPELLFLSFGMAFCYAFIFVYRRSFNSIKNSSHKKTIVELAKNLTLAYVLDLGMLFVMKDNSFMSFRMALGIGLVIGLILLYAGRVASGATRTNAAVREGKRRLILTGFAEEKLGNTKFIARENASWSAMAPQLGNSDEQEHDSDDLLNAIDILQDGKSRVVVRHSDEGKLTKRETVSTGR